ncbi:hypothetical protein Tco_0603866 [Tanacetum coccineum]
MIQTQFLKVKEKNLSSSSEEGSTPQLDLGDLSHSAYIKHTQEEATVLRDLVEHVQSKYLRDQSTKLHVASDEELEGPMKDQPLSADASPTALSPGYIANSDPEEDKEDPEEDPADHPADG